MKRFMGFMVSALAIALGGYGVYYSMLWEHSSTLAQQQWLERHFKQKGFTVAWEKNDNVTMATFSLKAPEAQTQDLYEKSFSALQESTFIKFFERSNGEVFVVFGERIHSIQQQQQGIISLSMPDKGQAWFKMRGGGEFVLQEADDVARLFPYDEVTSLRTRPLVFLYVVWIISGVPLMWGVAQRVRGIVRQKNLAKMRVRKAPVVREQVRIRRTRNINGLSTLPPPDDAKNNPEGKKQALLAQLRGFLDQAHDSQQREALEALYEEVKEASRLSVIEYATSVRADRILHPEDIVVEEIQVLESEAHESLVPEEQGRIEGITLQEVNDCAPQDLPCVKEILVVMLQPGGMPPFIGEHRIRKAGLKRLCTRNFSDSQFAQAYSWLVRQGVIVEVRIHGADGACSVNPHIDEAKTSEGKAIISTVIRARQHMVRKR